MSRIGRVLRDRGVQRRMGAAALSGVLLALAFPAFDIGALALASWGGVTLVSFVLVLVNASLVDLAVAVRLHARRSMIVAAAGVVVIVVAVGVADVARYQTHPSGHLRVAMLQGNDQDRYLTAEQKLSGYLTEHHLALADRLRGPYDLVVFPESSLDDFSPESNPRLRSRLVAVGERHGADVLANAAVPAPDGREFNQNQLYQPNGRLVGTYAKEHPVPFGEYVPFRSLVDWTGIVDRIPYDYSPGKTRTIFRVKGNRLASVI